MAISGSKTNGVWAEVGKAHGGLFAAPMGKRSHEERILKKGY
jgi:hypothetical protein